MPWHFNQIGSGPTAQHLPMITKRLILVISSLTYNLMNPAHPIQNSSKSTQHSQHRTKPQHHAPATYYQLAPVLQWSKNTSISSRQSGPTTPLMESHIQLERYPTWMVPGSHSRILLLILPLGKTFWELILTETDSPKHLNMAGICQFYQIPTRVIQAKITNLLMIILTLFANISKKNCRMVLLLVQSQRTYLSTYPGRRLQLLRNLAVRAKEGALLTVHNVVMENCTVLTTGYQLRPTEVRSTRYICQESKKSSNASSSAKRSTQGLASSCSSMIFRVFIGSCMSTQARPSTSSSSGRGTSTLTGCSPSATEGHVWKHNPHLTPSAGYIGHSCSLHPTDQILAWPVAAVDHASAAIILESLTWTTVFVSALKSTASFCSSSLETWQNLSRSSCPKPPDTFVHPAPNAQLLVSCLILILIQYLFQLTNSRKLPTWSTHGCREKLPCGKTWTPSVANFFTLLVWSLLADFISRGCSRQREGQTRTPDPSCWTRTSTWTWSGGTGASLAGTAPRTYSSTTTGTSPSTLVVVDGSAPARASVAITIVIIPTLPQEFPPPCSDGIFVISSFWQYSSPTGCGETTGLDVEWGCLLITKLRGYSSTTASQDRPFAYRWADSSPRCSSRSILESKSTEYQPLTTNSLIICLVRASQAWLTLLIALSAVLECRPLDYRYQTACSPSSCSPVAEDLVQRELRRLQSTARAHHNPPSTTAQPASTISADLLRAAAQHIQDQDRADSTKIAQNSRVRTYFQFAKMFNLSEFPPDGEQMVLYATWLALTTISTPDSLRQYLSSLKTFCTRQGMFCPSPTQYPPLQATIDGMAPLYAAPPRRSLPITPPILVQLLRTPPPTYPYNSWMSLTILKVFKAACILLYFTMLRSSNLMATHPAAACKIRQLTWDKVDKTDDGIIITMVLEKTIQHRQRLHKIPLKADPNSEFCPVRCLQDLVDMRGAQNIRPDDHVLQLPDGEGGWSPLCKYQLNKWLKHRIEELGLPADRYFIHGFRHGSLAEALAIEPNLTLVRLTSNHLSNAIFTYSHIQPEKRYQVSSKMLDSITTMAARLEQQA